MPTPERLKLEATNKLAVKLNTYEKQISKSLYDALQTMRADMSKIYEKYATNGVLTKADMARYNRYASMEKQMLAAIDPALKANLKVIARLTPEMYNESFFLEAWQIDSESGLRLNYGTINKNAIIEDLANPYDKIAYENYPRNAKQEIRKAINNGLTIGKSLTQMTRDLKKAMNITNTNAMRIIRTEAMTAQNAAANDIYIKADSLGINGDDIWDATRDMKTRPDHGHADGQVKDKKTGMFNLGGEQTPYPGWEGLSAKQRINCRCNHRYQIQGYSPQLMRTRDGGIVPYQPYDEWKKNYGKNNTPNKTPITSEKRMGIDLSSVKSYSDYVNKTYGSSPKDMKNMTPEMIQASNVYTNISYQTMNGYLRGNETALASYAMDPKSAAYEIKQIKILNSYVTKNPMKDPVTLYRGVVGDHAKSLKIGDEYIEKSFGSFSSIEDVASNFAGDKNKTIFRVITKQGDNFAPAIRSATEFNTKEGEFISAINSKYKITNITEGKGIKYIDMEMIK
jgi:hypothetical protein